MSKSTSSDKTLLEIIYKIEDAVDVNRLEYGGIRYWPYLRNRIFFENSMWQYASTGKNNKNKSPLKIINLIKSELEVVYDPSMSMKVRPAEIFTTSSTTSRVVLDDGLAINRFIDPLVKWSAQYGAQHTFYCEEYAPTAKYHARRLMPSAYQQRKLNRIDFLNKLWRIFGVYGKMDLDKLSFIRKMLLDSGFSTSYIAPVNLCSSLQKLVLHVNRYRKILSVVNPKIVFVVNYYSLPGYALMHAANARGCVTVDLQHGAQGPEHIAYIGYKSIPDGGWDLLPKLFWNWTESDANQINGWGRGFHVGKCGGVIWHEYLKSDIRINDKHRENIRENMRRLQKKYLILVSLQPLEGNEYINKIKEAIDSECIKDVYWLIRLHESMMGDRGQYIREFNKENCNVDLASDAPLPVILADTDLHVTRSSGVTIEASLLSVPTILEDGCALYPEWEQKGWARQLGKYESLSAVIRKMLDGDRPHGSSLPPANGRMLLKNILADAC